MTEKMIRKSINRKGRTGTKRDDVLNAATEEFLKSGFSETSMNKIAETAMVSKRTVYDHFPSKEDLFQAIADEILKRVDDMPRHSYSNEESMESQLEIIGNNFVQTITDREFMRFSRIVIARFIQSVELAKKANKAHEKLRHDMIDFFRSGTEAGKLNVENPEVSAIQFCGLIKEAAFWPELMAGQKALSTKEKHEIVQAAVQIFLAQYGVK